MAEEKKKKMPPSMEKLIREMKKEGAELDKKNQAEKEKKIADALSQVKTTQ